MAEFELQKLWEKEIQILDEIDRICKQYKLEYYLMWGTLLGAVRHKGFIPWDDDIDVGMPLKFYKKFLKIAKKELTEEYFLQTGLTDRWHPVPFIKIRLKNTAFYALGDMNVKRHHGIFVDIFPMQKRQWKDSFFNRIGNRVSSHIIQRRNETPVTTFRFLKIFPTNFLVKIRDFLLQGKGTQYWCDGALLDVSDFAPSINGEFQGKQYPIPKNFHNVLTKMYGNYMQLPPENQRVAHVPAFISFNLKEDQVQLEKYLRMLKGEQV